VSVVFLPSRQKKVTMRWGSGHSGQQRRAGRAAGEGVKDRARLREIPRPPPYTPPCYLPQRGKRTINPPGSSAQRVCAAAVVMPVMATRAAVLCGSGNEKMQRTRRKNRGEGEPYAGRYAAREAVEECRYHRRNVQSYAADIHHPGTDQDAWHATVIPLRVNM